MIILETTRLYLRQFLPEDASFLYQLNQDQEVIHYTGDTAFKNVQEALQLITGYDQYTRYGLGRLTVLRKTGQLPLGWCGLKYNADTQEIDLGYRFEKSFWNCGYATEAGRACLEFGFSKPAVTTIIARTASANTGSVNVLKKLGFQYSHDIQLHGMHGMYFTIGGKGVGEG